MNATLADQKAVESILKRIVAACTNGNLKELEKHFHPEMVIEGPEFRERKEGRDQCVQHHEEFRKSVDIQSFNESNYQVKVWGDTAVATYRFDAQFEADGQTRKESGQEVYAFSRENGEWRAVWNSIVPSTCG